MIGFLRGRLHAKHPPHLVVDVGGVGYELEAPMSTFYGLPAQGETVSLVTHLVVREDAHVLFGFATESERRLFRALIKISGVGPKVALGVLSGASVEEFLRILESGDPAALTRIPGVGRKTAERIVVELREGARKLGAAAGGEAAPPLPGEASSPQAEAFAALLALGYKPPEVTRLLKAAEAPDLSTTEWIRRALKAAARP